MTDTRSFYPDADERSAPQPGLGAPEWMDHLNRVEGRSVPQAQESRHVHVVEEPEPPRRWALGFLGGVMFGAMGALLYICLFVLLGQEVPAASIVIGVLAGSGLRLAGWRSGLGAALTASAIGAGMLYLAVAVGQASVDAINAGSDWAATVSAYVTDPSAYMLDYFSQPLLAGITLTLTVAGASLATLTFERRRD